MRACQLVPRLSLFSVSLLAYVTNYPRLSTSVHCKIELTLVALGQEPWSSGYVRRLMYEGCGFESWHHILDHFFTYICCKNWNDVCLKRPKINNKRGLWFESSHRQTFILKTVYCQLYRKDKIKKKEAGVGPFFKKLLSLQTSFTN